MRAFAFALLGVLAVSSSPRGAAEPRADRLDPLVAELLEWRAPRRDWTVVSKATREVHPRPDPRDTLHLWLKRDPARIANLLSYVTPDVPALRAVEAMAARDKDKSRFGIGWHERVADWLTTWRRRILPEHRDALVRAVRTMHQGRYRIEGTEDLQALVAVDPGLAEGLLEELRSNRDLRIVTFATVRLYERSRGESRTALREDLKRMVMNRRAPGYARAHAMRALLRKTWPGQDEWHVGLFEDPTLRGMTDHSTHYRPLNGIVVREPERWIPQLARMVGNPSRAVHDNAVSCLVQYHLDRARADALRPLIPWIADPSWSSADDRLRLLQSLDRVNLPECVPGLLIAIHRVKGYRWRAVIDALRHYKPASAIPTLRALLQKRQGKQQADVASALRACGGLDTSARFDAWLAHAQRLERGRDAEPMSEDAAIGLYLAGQHPPLKPVAERLLSHAEKIQAEAPSLAHGLRAVVGPWPREDPREQLLRQITSGNASAKRVAKALTDRGDLSRHFRPDLEAMVLEGGTAAGCAVVLLDDSGAADRLLEGSDPRAQQALLACARLVRMELDLRKIHRLGASGNAATSLAIDAFLLAMDTPEARRLYIARHPDDAAIVGTEGYETPDWESRLRREVTSKGGPNEVIALLSFGPWGSDGQTVIRITDQKARLSFYRREKEIRKFPLSPELLGELESFLANNNVHTLPAYEPATMDGMHYSFLRLRREGGYRIYMNNPGLDINAIFNRGEVARDQRATDIYARLTDFMRELRWQDD